MANINIKELLEFHKKQNSLGTITGVRPLAKFGIVHHNKEDNKVIGFSQNLVGDFGDKENYHDFLINGGFMVFKKKVLDMIPKDAMIEELFIPMAQKKSCPCSIIKANGKPWTTIRSWKKWTITGKKTRFGKSGKTRNGRW